MIEFNQRGLITPDRNILASLEEFATVFVRSMPTAQRTELFSNYVRYMTELYTTLGDLSFVQWINGSFTTSNASPKDIDIVTFINFDVVARLDKQLEQFKYPMSLQYSMDAYIVRVFPIEHRLFALYAGDRAYWLDKFSKTERNRRGVIYRKGFVELIHSDEERATLKSLRSNP